MVALAVPAVVEVSDTGTVSLTSPPAVVRIGTPSVRVEPEAMPTGKVRVPDVAV